MNLQDATKIKSAARKLKKINPVISVELEGIIERNYNETPTLQDVFDAQIKLNERTVPGLYQIIKSDEPKVHWLKNYHLAMQQEQAELIDSLDWKFWKKGQNDWQNAKVELVDILHFWVSMCTVVGLDAKSVMDLYFKKNKLNHKRQEQGYQDGAYDKYAGGVEDNVREVTNG